MDDTGSSRHSSHELPEKFAPFGLTYDDVLLLPDRPTWLRPGLTPPLA